MGKWEQAAIDNCPEGHPVAFLRTGVVLCRGAGALGKMELPFRMGAGGRIGPGTQGFSWISLRDYVQAVMFVIDNAGIVGPVNITAAFCDQAIFAQALASALSRPCLLPAPAFAVRMLLGSKMANALVLSNYRVEPRRLLASGFVFQDTDLATTLCEMYAS